MGAPDPVIPVALPSKAKLLVATLVASAAAAVILVTAVLPVEYGLDPVGTGKVFGLLREPAQDQALTVPQGGDASMAAVRQGAVTLYPRTYKVDTVELVLEPYEYVEYKYHLIADAGMIFSWSANTPLVHEFHGDPDENPHDVRSYDKSTKSNASGSFIAPVTGIHGWFWENPSGERVTIKLTSAGFYTHAVEFRSDKTQRRHELADVPTPAGP
ncbi:MAG: hypothetical protein K2P94_15255 [Rhodospirillaceae bacterium]|nr:hypothetical protein [Rhodospirillaceae bacterium]